MRVVLPALLLPVAVGCVPIGARTAPPGSKIKDAPPAAIVVNQVGYFPGL